MTKGKNEYSLILNKNFFMEEKKKIKGEATQVQPTGREAITSRLREYNPELSLESDDEIYAGLDGYLTERDKSYESLNGKMKELADIFNEYPQVASFFLDLVDGRDSGEANFYRALARNFGGDLQAVLDSKGAEAAAYDEGMQEYGRRDAERKRKAEEFKHNADAAMQEYEQWLADEGITDADRQEFENSLVSLSEELGAGKFMGLAKALMRSRRYDSDLEAARAEGEIRGRNARIAEQRTLPQNGDGIPSPEQGGSRREAFRREGKETGWRW